jgi:hypothetical protein
MGDRKVGVFIDANGGDAVLSRVKPYLESAHLAFVNLESPISDKGARKTGKQYTFRSRTALAGGLAGRRHRRSEPRQQPRARLRRKGPA